MHACHSACAKGSCRVQHAPLVEFHVSAAVCGSCGDRPGQWHGAIAYIKRNNTHTHTHLQVKVNTDESPQVATDYGVRSIPTVMVSNFQLLQNCNCTTQDS